MCRDCAFYLCFKTSKSYVMLKVYIKKFMIECDRRVLLFILDFMISIQKLFFWIHAYLFFNDFVCLTNGKKSEFFNNCKDVS